LSKPGAAKAVSAGAQAAPKPAAAPAGAPGAPKAAAAAAPKPAAPQVVESVPQAAKPAAAPKPAAAAKPAQKPAAPVQKSSVKIDDDSLLLLLDALSIRAKFNKEAAATYEAIKSLLTS